MQNSILITAYTDIPYLFNLVEKLCCIADIYIHIDKKTNIKHSFLNALENIKNVKSVGCIYSVNWGGRRHVDAILWLCKEALKKSPNSKYYHLISGNDIYVKEDCFLDVFANNNSGIYMNYFSLPSTSWEGGGMNRLMYKHPLDRLNIRNYTDYCIYQRYIKLQIRNNVLRDLPTFSIYGGSSWWSITHNALKYILENYNWNGWYDRLEDTFVPDEMYFQTLLLNSPFKENVVNDNLRYILWEEKNGHLPAILDETNIADILSSNAIFARKVQNTISRKLIDYFDKKELSSNEIL